ncbi:MAG: cell division ATP-binding protein FtsE [Desulfobulbus sp.]|jgi:cell division transport system ATP-binding protein
MDTRPSNGIIDLVKVGKTYPPNVQALVDVTLNIDRGEMVYLTGMSGAGKTTLLHLISRVEKADKGVIEVAGIDLTNLPQRKIHLLRRKIGFAFQDFKLLPERTVAYNIALALEVVYTPAAVIEKRVRELLQQLNLVRKYATRANELSRGEQQRVAIARAVATAPEIILADEPTGNLDADTTGRVMDLFHRHNQMGATIVIATHDRSLYDPARDRVVELHFGRMRGTPTPEPRAAGPAMEV